MINFNDKHDSSYDSVYDFIIDYEKLDDNTYKIYYRDFDFDDMVNYTIVKNDDNKINEDKMDKRIVLNLARCNYAKKSMLKDYFFFGSWLFVIACLALSTFMRLPGPRSIFVILNSTYLIRSLNSRRSKVDAEYEKRDRALLKKIEFTNYNREKLNKMYEYIRRLGFISELFEGIKFPLSKEDTLINIPVSKLKKIEKEVKKIVKEHKEEIDQFIKEDELEREKEKLRNIKLQEMEDEKMRSEIKELLEHPDEWDTSSMKKEVTKEDILDTIKEVQSMYSYTPETENIENPKTFGAKK